MAIVDLTAYLPEVWTDGDVAHDVGAVTLMRNAHATEVIVDGDTLVYGAEIPVQIGFLPRNVNVDIAGTRTPYRFFRLEICPRAADDGAFEPIATGTDFVIGERPISQMATYVARVRLGNKKARAPISLGPSADFHDVAREIDGRTTDYWETGTNRPVAGVLFPDPNDGRSRRNLNDNYCLAIGLCADFTSCRDKLVAGEKAQTLLRMARTNTLNFGFPDALKTSSAPIRLYDDVRDGAAEFLLHAAAQALAGRRQDEDITDIETELDHNFRAILNNENRRQRNLYENRNMNVSSDKAGFLDFE